MAESKGHRPIPCVVLQQHPSRLFYFLWAKFGDVRFVTLSQQVVAQTDPKNLFLEDNSLIPGTIMDVFINPANAKVIQIAERRRNLPQPIFDNSYHNILSAFASMQKTVEERVRGVLHRFTPGGIPKESFVMAYSVIFGSRFRQDAVSLGLGPFTIEQVMEQIPGVRVFSPPGSAMPDFSPAPSPSPSPSTPAKDSPSASPSSSSTLNPHAPSFYLPFTPSSPTKSPSAPSTQPATSLANPAPTIPTPSSSSSSSSSPSPAPAASLSPASRSQLKATAPSFQVPNQLLRPSSQPASDLESEDDLLLEEEGEDGEVPRKTVFAGPSPSSSSPSSAARASTSARFLRAKEGPPPVLFSLTQEAFRAFHPAFSITCGSLSHTRFFSSFQNGRFYRLPERFHDHQIFYSNGLKQNEEFLDDVLGFERMAGQQLLVGLDAEWFPTFSAFENSKVALLQLAFSHHVILMPLFHLPMIPRNLHALLSDPHILKSGQGIHGDGNKLQQDYGIFLQGRVDLQLLGTKTGLKRNSLKGWYTEIFGDEMPKDKKTALSNWEAHELTREQVKYAAMDAIVSREVLVGLAERCQQKERLRDWLMENGFVE